MYLKSLELSGFKSFPKKTTLHFNSAITAIVGPNGSGKSNVAEAFRFVLGEQSIKSMRGKHGEDMIWNGGGQAQRSNRASVRLTFDNSRRVFSPIDFDEVVVERVVHRDNTHEYLVNGSQVRLKDILEILAGAHVGSSGHHIISQGEADRILSAKPSERREMIEDALGLRVFQWKKLESVRKLAKTETNMEQVESLRREIAPHVRFLKKQTEKIAMAEGWRLELVSLYREYFAREWARIKSEREGLSANIAGPTRELSSLEQEMEKTKGIIEISQDRNNLERITILEKKLSDIQARKSSTSRELGRLEGELGLLKKSQQKEKNKTIKEEARMIYVKDLESVIERIQGFGAIESTKQLLSEIIRTLKDFVSGYRPSVDSSILVEIEKEISKNDNARTNLESSLASLNEEQSELNLEYHKSRKELENEKDKNHSAEKEIFRMMARQNELISKISSIRSAQTELDKQAESLKSELGEAGILVGRGAVDYSSVTIVGDPALGQKERKHTIEKLKIRLEDADLGGGSELLKEYKETRERDAFLEVELLDLAKARSELLRLIKDLDIQIDREFRNGLIKINAQFEQFFKLMFGGGRASLNIVSYVRHSRIDDDIESAHTEGDLMPSAEGSEHSEEPDGLEVDVSLPRKKVKGLMMLSGGERALTSIALLFAISQANPPPFIILDETDAALDEANSSKYGDMVESLSKHSQLILITHNRSTMSRAGVLYGVTMGADGASRLLSIAFEKIV
ncbi:MAG: hypothetical protein A3B11_01225 [Candidatus Taylorbacteria bacterium RIFCSPLOWO2_01_FULL_44_26]|uniref:RecF/RecN/SMC N-terminal domain-containing protein n=1 Tax=Candidatus Taylorbacteria bacterium RIFCSPLOWO2_01_FULL_44_26 TaxID=1802318 RepID=A0A1G2N4K3_9BACT|nr:MAG: hypothetical protein A3B11_01225 [Candidatus Taylorbacteria bacterium RIFCSPLOWO2_01_FULL_44_26]